MSVYRFAKGNKARLVRWKDGEEIPFTDCEVMHVTTVEQGRPGYLVLNQKNELWNVPDEWLEPGQCVCNLDTLMARGCRCGWMKKEREASQ